MNRLNIPEGARDLVSNECLVKEQLILKTVEVFKQFNYEEVITPTIEYYQTFNIDDSGVKEEEIYKFFDNKGRILVLRPDMTIPIARAVSTKLKERELPLRVRYTSNVFRVNESLGGKRNEYTDCGVELIGSDEESGDLEILLVALDLLKRIGVSDFKLEIGNINLFKEATKDLNISREEKKMLGELVEKKSLKALEDFLEKINLDEVQKKFFLKLPWLFGDKNILEEGRAIAFNEGIKNSLNKLSRIYRVLTELGYEKYISLDLGMAPRLNYYTGIIFRGYVSGVGSSVINGGRYDNLFKKFGGNIKAIGFSIKIDLLINVTKLKKNGNIVYNINYNSENLTDALKSAQSIIKEGFIVNLKLDESVKEVKVEKEEI